MTNSVQIRPADYADAAVIDAIVQRSYGRYVERIGRRPAPMDDDYKSKIDSRYAFVAEDPEVIGLIVLIPRSDHLLVENVAVEPGRQGEGIGRELLGFAEGNARKQGLYELRLYTNTAMTENLAFYPRLGYQETRRRIDGGFERVFFKKRLVA